MSMGLRDLCIALFGVSLGVGGTVGVTTVKQKAVARQEAAAPAKPRAVSRNHRAPEKVAAPACPIAPQRILDCPAPAPSLGNGTEGFDLVQLTPQAPPGGPSNPFTPWPGGGGGGVIISPPPGVPAPKAWVMMIAGWGLVGLSLRRRPTAHSE
jgi:hypothetical protein